MKYLKYVLWLVALLPLMFFRDFTPANELRYLSIADEAIRDGHLFAFFNHGIAYADKPPLYLWLVMLSKGLWGSHIMLWLGLFSIIPAFLILYVMDKWMSAELDKQYRTAGQLVLLTTAYFIGSGIVLRMDMLMSLFILLALYTFFKMYTGKDKAYDRWLFPLYIFLALFTKGPLGVLIPVVSIIVFLLWQKQIKQVGRYLGIRTWMVILILSGCWLGVVYLEGGKEYINNLVFHQTVNRAVDAFHHKRPFYYYFMSMSYTMAPWIFLFIAVIIATIRNHIKQSVLERFLLMVSVSTILLLSCISSKLQIYLLPAYPFFVFWVISMMAKMGKNKWVTVSLGVTASIYILVFPGVCLAATQLDMLQNYIVYITAFVLMLSGVVAWVVIYRYNRLLASIRILSIGLLLTIFIGSWVLPGLNSEMGYASLAEQLKQVSADKGISRYYTYRMPNAVDMDVFLDEEVKLIPNDSLEQIKTIPAPYILFMPTKNVQSDGISEYLKGKEQEVSGNYTIVIFN